jgi:hypothetical protein
MLRKMTLIAAAAVALSTLSDTDGFARGGGHGGGFGGMRGSALGRGAASFGMATQLGIGAMGAAMATQQRIIPPSSIPGPQINVPQTGNPVARSTLSSFGPDIGPAPGYGYAGGSRWQPSQSQLPRDIRIKEGSISAYEKAVDQKLNICRGC